ncbi:hypothetical protein HYT92_00275 [Candidatus Pacearchaeota archaeon]|nr:hypothetical protein [Candidatus Pacearchaeota archaeon]
MNKVIIPRTYVRELTAPLIFLAGPIRCAPNWQDEAIEILFSQEPNLIIASPRRGVRDKIACYIAPGDETYFSRQRAWERHYLDIASKTGAILFWLPGEAEHDCNKEYGAMTRVELGQWMTNYRNQKNNVPPHLLRCGLQGHLFLGCSEIKSSKLRPNSKECGYNFGHNENVRFCIGSDGNFSELHTIKYDLKLDAPGKEISKTLEETCMEALRLARQKPACP